MKLRITGNGYADKDGDQMQITIEYGQSEFSLWFPASLADELDGQWDRALIDGRMAIDRDVLSKHSPQPLEVPEA